MSKNELIDIRMAELEAFVANAGQKGVTKEMADLLKALDKAAAAVRQRIVVEDMN